MSEIESASQSDTPPPDNTKLPLVWNCFPKRRESKKTERALELTSDSASANVQESSSSKRPMIMPDLEVLARASNDASARAANMTLESLLLFMDEIPACDKHEMLVEIRDTIFHFLDNWRPHNVLNTQIVSRIRAEYVRSFNLAVWKFPYEGLPVEEFLQIGSSNSQAFEVYIKWTHKLKLDAFVGKLGTDQETANEPKPMQKAVTKIMQHLEKRAKTYAIGNKALATCLANTCDYQVKVHDWILSYFVPTFSSETIRQYAYAMSGAICKGWMTGIGVGGSPQIDTIGQLFIEYEERFKKDQLQKLKDDISSLTTSKVVDLEDVVKLISQLQLHVDKRNKIIGGADPPKAEEDLRLESLLFLEEILKQVEDIRGSSLSKKIGSLAVLEKGLPFLNEFDIHCGQSHIDKAREAVQLVTEEEYHGIDWKICLLKSKQKSVPFLIICGVDSMSEDSKLVVKNDKHVDGICVFPPPLELLAMKKRELLSLLETFPKSLSELARGITVDAVRRKCVKLHEVLSKPPDFVRSLC